MGKRTTLSTYVKQRVVRLQMQLRRQLDTQSISHVQCNTRTIIAR